MTVSQFEMATYENLFKRFSIALACSAYKEDGSSNVDTIIDDAKVLAARLCDELGIAHP